MAWVFLLAAGVFEIGWPLGFKLAQTTGHRLSFILVAVISMGVSGWLLYLAQRSIPIGTAYAIWTGIGATGAFTLGILMFGEVFSLGRLLGVSMVVGGVIMLKITGVS